MRTDPLHPSFTSAHGIVHEWSDPHRSVLQMLGDDLNPVIFHNMSMSAS